MALMRPLVLLLLASVLAACDRGAGPGDTDPDGFDQVQSGTQPPEQTATEAPPEPEEPVLEAIAELESAPVAITASADNRLFIALESGASSQASLVEMEPDGDTTPWPDSVPPESGQPPGDIRALHIDDEGALWVLDAGPRLLRIDLTRDEFTHEIALDEAFPDTGHQPDGVGVDAELGVAYLIDSGRPALVALDMYTGEMWRVLTNTSVLQAATETAMTRARMVLSPDLRYLVWQPPGRNTLFRLETEVMQFTELPDEELLGMVEAFGEPGTVQAMTMDAGGLLYVVVTGQEPPALVRFDPFGTPETVIRDPRLAGISALGATHGGDLLIGTRGAGENGPRLLRLWGIAR